MQLSLRHQTWEHLRSLGRGYRKWSNSMPEPDDVGTGASGDKCHYEMHFRLCSSPVPAETGPPIGSSVAGAMTSAEADSSQEEGEHHMEME